jgi:hypothetical protein
MESRELKVDKSSRADLLLARLGKIMKEGMPTLGQLEHRWDYLYFHSVPTLDNLNGDLGGDRVEHGDLMKQLNRVEADVLLVSKRFIEQETVLALNKMLCP